MASPSPQTVVLVVEDEPLIRMMAVDLVEDAGFIAVEAANADEALCILECRDDIRIVFTDIDMPGSMDGMKLADAIRDRWPPLDLILVSGHMCVRQEDLPARGKFFAKPYDPSAIAAQLQSFAAH